MQKRVALVGVLLLGSAAMIDAKINLKVGDSAPQFELLDQDGKKVSFPPKGKKVVLYFYPMDDTYGCRKQACSLRDGFSDLKKAGITVFGISADSVKSHKKFKDKEHLPFTLLSDESQKVAELYGVKRGFLFSWIGTKRVTFLVNEHGKIVGIIKNIKLKDHAHQIIDEFKSNHS